MSIFRMALFLTNARFFMEYLKDGGVVKSECVLGRLLILFKKTYKIFLL